MCTLAEVVNIERMDNKGEHYDVVFLDVHKPSHINETLYYRLTFQSYSLILHLTDLQEKNYVDGLVITFSEVDTCVLKDIHHCFREGFVRGEQHSIVMVNICNGMVII